MARRRYLSTKISHDAKINRLAMRSDFAALLYTWMIPHAEDDGTLSGDPEELLMTVMPGRRDKEAADIEAALTVICDMGLITWCRDGAHPHVAFPESFYQYQSYITDKRRGTAQGGNNAASSAHDSADDNESAQNAAKQRTSAQNAASFKSSFKVKLESSSDGEDSSNSSDSFFVAADADDAPLSDTTPSSQPHTSSEQKTATGKRRATAKTSPARAATFAPDSEAYRLATYLRDAILAHKPDANVPRDAKTLQGWAVITDKMMRLDKRDPAKIRAVIDWATRDTFWAANVLSPGGLRDKFDRLEMEMGRKASASNGNGHNGNGKKTGKSGAYGDAFTMDADEYSRMMREGMENMGFTTNGTTGGTRDK